MARRTRFALGGSFRAVRSLVSFLGLRGSRAPRSSPSLTYTKSWDASPYIAGVWVRYLKQRPEYNAGWKTMVDNMIFEIESGGVVKLKITKNHSYNPSTGVHDVDYDFDYYSNLENATNHPDLMSEYISNMKDILRDYIDAYRDSEGSFGDSSQEWGTRKAALEKYQYDVEDLMSEID